MTNWQDILVEVLPAIDVGSKGVEGTRMTLRCIAGVLLYVNVLIITAF